MGFLIRDFDPGLDKPAALSFIDGSQLYEHAFEPNRRLDAAVADEYFAALMQQVETSQGRVFVAEEGGAAIGWAVLLVEQHLAFVIAEERAHGYLAELFVSEVARGRGVGQALIAACEEETRRRGLGHINIGVLAGNTRAVEIYRRAGFSPYSFELRKYL